MFILRAIKRLVYFLIFCVLIYLAAHYPVNGRPLYKVGLHYVTSSDFKTGLKDIKMFFGSFLKSLGEEIQEDVTEHDRRELKTMIEKEVRKGEPHE